MHNMDALIPQIGVITDIREETPDTKTFLVVGENAPKPFAHMPGQCAMIGVPGVGEAMFSISSSPTNGEFMEFSIKCVGKLTNFLHGMAPYKKVTIRGAYGRPFPVSDELKGKNLLFIAGGIGLAPLRSVIRYTFDKRADYGSLNIVYGARSARDLVFLNEIRNEWKSVPDTKTFLTIDREDENWDGHVGFVPSYVSDLGFKPDSIALVCGPPIMIKYTLEALIKNGFSKEQVYTTLEMRMKCGIGKCGRCNIGSKLCCKDGPVFRSDELDYMPDEY